MHQKIALLAARHALHASGQEFKTFFEHGTLAVELYKPDGTDKQTPHDRDEVYLIASGHGTFVLEGDSTTIQTGDFLFVPAGAAHRFVEFSADFSTWVLFYGPSGGESGTPINHLS
ncbi:Cupin domain-containing protein [Catalinimonas alkaloidigena]|uniref:Cupin domain-containing protein n=1 Tax=Catalinimonas alkaloidigena TaxID=1075417 RepID=A0A1G9GAY4_9BACT|nr:cupin domain-containing protein [Catalinimonas alkaloidigena]SDK97443.1 Cupin domain-containing protein [Catalinimonas alkaloidigena]